MFIENPVKQVITILLLGLALVQLLFASFQKNEADRTLTGLNPILRNEEIGSDPYKISAELVDLADEGLIRCPVLTESSSERAFLNRRDLVPCSSHPLALSGVQTSRSFKSINNLSWDIELFVPNSSFFYVALWSSRTVVLLLALALYLVFLANQRKLILAKEVATLERKNAERIEDLAKQVAHDLRSPLSAINVVISRSQLSVEEKTLLNSANRRINGIADDLLNNHVQLTLNIPLREAIDKIWSEKEVEHVDKNIEFIIKNDLGKKVFAGIPEKDLLRVLSNLINNSVEALSNTMNPKIELSAASDSANAFIDLTDNGRGIPENVLKRVWEKGFSFGKSKKSGAGSGLGLHHAKSTIENVGGSISVRSLNEGGTFIKIVLPVSSL